MEATLNQNDPDMMMFARDVNLPQILIEKYEPGMIIPERGFVDAAASAGGKVTNCRFKVPGVHTYRGKTAVFLLLLPCAFFGGIFLPKKAFSVL